MLKIEKIKEEILNFNHANDALRCYLARVTTKQSNIDGCCRPNLRCEECLKVSLMGLLEEYKEPWNIDNILANCEVIEDEKS